MMRGVRSKHVEPSINFGIINSITKLYLVGISTESYYDAQIHKCQINMARLNFEGQKMKLPGTGKHQNDDSSISGDATSR